MPIDTSQLATDLSNVIVDLPTTFIYKSVSYTGVFTDLSLGNKLEEGGFVSEFDAQMFVLQSVFTTLPVAGEEITVSSAVYRIDKTSKSPDGAAIRLDLMTPDK